MATPAVSTSPPPAPVSSVPANPPVLVSADVPDAAKLAPRKEGDDMVMGSPTAPATIIEYASLTCPHCANFATNTFPQLKSAYIDKGLVKYIYRDFPLDRMALQASKLARCLGPERYFAFIDVLFSQQQNWTRSDDPNQIIENLKRLARLGGMSETAADACLKDSAVENAVLQQSMNGEREFKVNATPTIIINGRKYSGDLSFEELDKTLKSLVGPS
jgi:protein-disulfide isomerase